MKRSFNNSSRRQASKMAEALKMLDKKEELEHLEDLEDLEHTEGIDHETLEALEHLAEVNPAAARAVENSLKKANNNMAQSTGKLVAASVTVKVTRQLVRTTGANAFLTDANGNPVALPAPLFGCLEIASNYTRVITANLPQDGSVQLLSFALTADAQSILLTYKNTADTIRETVLIQSTNAVWTNLIRGLASAAFTIKKPKMILGDVLKQNQFDEPINIFQASMFTKATQDSINPNDYKPEYLGDNSIRVLKDLIPVDPEKTLIPMIVQPTLNAAEPLQSTFNFSIVMQLSEFRKFAEYANTQKKARPNA